MAPGTPLVAICDDEADLRRTVAEYLNRRGFAVAEAASASELDAVLRAGPEVALVLLDIAMPGEDGLSVLARLRRETTLPVIMLTASGTLVDRVVGLELGADDYIAKPFELRELEARIKSVLRRTREPQATAAAETRRGIAVGHLRFDPESGALRDAEGRTIALTPMEFRTLQLFVENRGRVLSRDRLLELADERGWEAFDRSVDLRVSRLRRKIEPNPAEPRIIRTVRSLGYILDAEPSAG